MATSILTILITIIGWYTTLSNQKKLIHAQLEADKNKYITEISIRKKLEDLDYIEKWREEGKRIEYAIEIASENISINRLNKWRSTYLATISRKLNLIEFDSVEIAKLNNHGLGFWLHKEYFYNCCVIEKKLGLGDRSGIDDEIELLNEQIRISVEVEYRLTRMRSNILGLPIEDYDEIVVGQLVEIGDGEIEEITQSKNEIQ